MSRISRDFNLDLNVLFGNITELQGEPYGNLIVEFTGPAAEIQNALTAIRSDTVKVEEVQHYAS